ncbi:hypothetical protein WCH_DB18600 [Waddlia chondrophila 2032/99]|uniref:Uncharacterized protein n=1 Tax=Waddlia chondrophila 2032/99 TaxID=765953 RepID=F8LFI5_9BACT|nr:hypothetical protein WCH_DB18600 [Waddlia chondrophila 2032/99]
MSSQTPTLEKEDIERIFLGFAVEAQKQMSEDIYMPKKKVIVLSGPTACGKTEFAIELAKALMVKSSRQIPCRSIEAWISELPKLPKNSGSKCLII